MKILDPQDLTVGCAVTLCCHLDLDTIETEERLREVQADWDDEIGYEAWSSDKEAYLDIAKRWPDGSDERMECLRLASETPNVAAHRPTKTLNGTPCSGWSGAGALLDFYK